MNKEVKNFLRFGGWLNARYGYVDTVDHMADSVFYRRQIPVKFGDEFVKDNEKYIFVMCKVKRKHIEEFEKALSEISNKMNLTGNTDYDAFCEKFMNEMQEGGVPVEDC